MTDDLDQRLLRIVTRVVSIEKTKVLKVNGQGVVYLVEGQKARFEAEGPTYTFPPSLDVRVGDLVQYLRVGAYLLITHILNRKGVTTDFGDRFQMLRAQSMGAITTGAVGEATFTWPVPFVDVNYIVVATPRLDLAILPPALHVRSQTIDDVTIRLNNRDGATQTFLIDIVGIHD